MSDLTEKFTTLEGQLSDQQTALMSAIADLQTATDLVNTNLAILQENGAVNTKALLAALGQTGVCFPCPTPSIVVPPIGTTPSTANLDHCKRAQAFVAAVGSILTAFDTMQSFNVIGTYNVISDAISEVIGAIAAGDTLPLPSFPEAVQIVGTYVSYAGERIFTGVSIMDNYTPLHDDLVSALFATTTPGDAKTAFESVVDGSDASQQAKYLIKATAFQALYSYYFDPSTMPDLSAYDGFACGTPVCQTWYGVINSTYQTIQADQLALAASFWAELNTSTRYWYLNLHGWHGPPGIAQYPTTHTDDFPTDYIDTFDNVHTPVFSITVCDH